MRMEVLAMTGAILVIVGLFLLGLAVVIEFSLKIMKGG